MKQTKRWLLAEPDPSATDRLESSLGLSNVIARLLVRRGVAEVDSARRFLNPNRLDFYDPFLMKDMEKAVARIRQAIEVQERIMIYGDYDADGATSTSLLYLALKRIGANVEFYIPDRFAEGYGLNGPAIIQAKEQGFDLIITVDNGITAVEEIRLANDLGIDLIVTDHHTPPAVLPDAYAILNPKQPGCTYPDKMLAGVGVAFKLVQALFGELPEEYLDLAAIGTVADLAPLVDENRLLTYYGLEQMNSYPRAGIKALIEVSGLTGKEITAGHIGFSFGPRINASGRLDSATYAVELLTTDDVLKADELAQFLNERNVERQELSAQIFEEAVQMVESHPEWLEGRVLVVAGEGWNAGVIGIVASRLVEKYYRPTLMISITDGVGKGSARSIDGFHLYNAMDQCRDLFDHFGGHKMAAGFSLQADQIDNLRSRLNETAEVVMTMEDLIPKVDVDAEVDLPDVSLDFIKSIEQLAPFGFGNPSPRFQLRGLSLERCRRVGQSGDHLQIVAGKGAAQIGGIAFRRGEEADLMHDLQRIDLVGELTTNEWNGKTSVQIHFHDWRPNQIQVFDRRRIENKQNWLEEQAGQKSLTVVCFHPESVDEVKKALQPYPWQEMHRHRVVLPNLEGNIQSVFDPAFSVQNQYDTANPLNDELTELTLTSDIVFYDLPQTLKQYHSVVDQLSTLLSEVRLYVLYGNNDKSWVEQKKRNLLPDRKIFTGIYKILQEMNACSVTDIRSRLQPAFHEAVDVVMSVFVELGFAVQDGNTYHVNKGTTKQALDSSTIYQTQQERVEEYNRIITSLLDTTTEQMNEKLMNLLLKTEGVQVS